MLKTYKVKHGLDLKDHLRKAQLVVKHVMKVGYCTSKGVKHIGLHSHFATPIIRKYSRIKTIKEAKLRKVKLSFCLANRLFEKESNSLRIPALKTSLKIWFPTDNIIKWNHMEFGPKYAHIVVTLPDQIVEQTTRSIGVDLNATSHQIVVASPHNGKVLKLGRELSHLKKKYKNIRSKLYSERRFKELKRCSRKEQNKTKEVIYQSINAIIKLAKREKCSIKLEDLKGIRARCTKKSSRSAAARELNHTVNSWNFFQIKVIFEQKAKEHGIEVLLIDPKWTSQACSRCGHTQPENRVGKRFECLRCKHVDHADVNAAFNIAMRPRIDLVVKKVKIKKKSSSTSIPSERPEVVSQLPRGGLEGAI